VRLGEWAVLAGLAAGLGLVVRAIATRPQGRPWTGSRLVAALCGVALVAILVAQDGGDLARLPATLLARPIALVVAALVVGATLALVDVAHLRGVPALGFLLRNAGVPEEHRSGAAMAAIALAVAAVSLIGAIRLDRPAANPGGIPNDGGVDAPSPTAAANGTFASVRSFALPGKPLAVAMRDERTGYVTLDSGDVLEVTLPRDASANLETRSILSGLDHPRGVAYRDGRLFVVERGPLPCASDVEFCDASDINPTSGVDGEVAIMSKARARVLAFDVAADGTAQNRTVVIEGLPVADALHGANDITVGPDGMLYLAVGNVDYLFRAPERAIGITPHPEWLGTVLRFDGAGNAPEVVAKGLRNVYQVAFDDQGRMWGVDNDGPTMAGWRAEEVLQIKPGRNYGFPFDATYGPWTVRDDGPAWVSRHKASAGVAWAGSVGLGAGLLVGNAGTLSLISQGEILDLWKDDRLAEYFEQDLLDVPGSLSSLQVIAPNRVVASLYGSDAGALYVIDVK